MTTKKILLKTLLWALPLTAAAQIPAGGDSESVLAEAAGRPFLRLEQFEQFALESNPTLREAEALVRQAAAEARQSALYPNPVVGYQGEQIRGGSFHGGEQGGFVQQTFPLGGKRGARREVFEQERAAADLGTIEQRYRILSDVGQSFYSARAAQEVIAVRKRLVSLARDSVATAHQLANVGQADAPDVLQAEVEAEQAEVDLSTAERAYLQAFQTLAAAAGKPELAVSPIAGNLVDPPQLDTANLTEQILSASPTVKVAEQEVVRAEAELKSARRETVPDLQIRAGVQQSFEQLGEAPRSRVGAQGFASAGIALPVFNRNQGNIAAARAAIDYARSDATRVRLMLRQKAAPMVQNYLAARHQAERYRTAIIPQASRAYQMYLAKYQSMAAAYPQVLVSQRTLFQLQVAYINALETAWTSSIALRNYLLGSGLTMPAAAGTGAVNLPNAGGGAQ